MTDASSAETLPAAGVTASIHSRQLLLVGLEHHYHQYVGATTGRGAPQQLMAFLREKCAAHNPDLLAEELSQEDVDLEGARNSVLRALATEFGLPHLFCDPDGAERQALKYPVEEIVKVTRFNGDAVKAADYMKQFWPIREGEWMRRIIATEARKCLLVIGAAHVETLSIRAVEFDYSPVVLCDRWRPGL